MMSAWWEKEAGLMEIARGRALAGYRTMPCMQRRRSFVQDRLGTKEDFSSRTQPEETTVPASAAYESEYVGDLERLAQLRERGILPEEEVEAKKKQILGI